MGLYPPIESVDGYRLHQKAEVKFRLEKERDFGASLYMKYRRGVNIVDGLEIMLSAASVGLAASGIRLLSTIITVPVAVGFQAGAIVCGLLSPGSKLLVRRLQAKAKKKHDKILTSTESKLNIIADHASAALIDDKIFEEEEFRLKLSEVDKRWPVRIRKKRS